MNVEERVGLVEEAILILRDLNINHGERLDDYFRALRESREDFEFKLNALIDAQMRNESEIKELKDSTNALKEASKSQLGRIENLENK